MTNSLNGWPGIPDPRDPLLATGRIPGTSKSVTLRRGVLPVFLAFLADWNTQVHPIDYKGALGPDGWEYRDARTGAGLSCHASGTAVDVTYDWLRPTKKQYMNPAQTRAVHNLLDKYTDVSGRRLFAWGGDWLKKNSAGQYLYIDEMHVELCQSWAVKAQGRATTAYDVEAVMRKLNIADDGSLIRPTPQPVTIAYKNLGLGKKNADVLTIQRALAIYVGLDYSTGPSVWGPRTQAAWLKAAAKARRTGVNLAKYLGTIYHFGVTP